MFVCSLCFYIFAVPLVLSAVAKDNGNTCSLTEYPCSDGGCISAELVCDGRGDCADGSDEATCQSLIPSRRETVLNRLKRQAACRKNQWRCRDGTCIPFDGKCDGVVDCPDGSDEKHALCWKTQCQSNWFRCTYGACVDGTAPCNGLQECADNSDELLPRCRNETEEVRGRFKCKDGSYIPASNHCDGQADCPDGSDETVQACAGKSCPSYLFQCAYGACVDSGANCNKIQECADNSDEADDLCGGSTTTSVQIAPTSGNCVLPPYPEHGSYTTNIRGAQPGLSYKYVTINVTCNRAYGVQGPSSIGCQDGVWQGNAPKCVRQCRLDPHPSIEYFCLVSGDVTGTRACNAYEPVNQIVRPECRRPNYYYPTTLTNMKCIDGYWNYVARCKPGLIKKGTNITIIIKDTVEVFKSEFEYVSTNESSIDEHNTNSHIDDRFNNNKGSIYHEGQFIPFTEDNSFYYNTIDGNFDNDIIDWWTENSEKELPNKKPDNIHYNITNSSIYINMGDKIVFRE